MATKVLYAPYTYLNIKNTNTANLYVSIPLLAQNNVELLRADSNTTEDIKVFEFRVITDTNITTDWFYYKRLDVRYDPTRPDLEQSIEVRVLDPSSNFVQTTMFFTDLDLVTLANPTHDEVVNTPYVYLDKINTMANGSFFDGHYLMRLDGTSFQRESFYQPDSNSYGSTVTLSTNAGVEIDYIPSEGEQVGYMDDNPIDGFFEVVTDHAATRKKGKTRNKPADTKPGNFWRPFEHLIEKEPILAEKN